MIMTIFSLRFVPGNLPEFRSTEELVSPEIKRQRIHHMAERCVSGEFGGSAWHATKSPTTARMGISKGAIQRQMRRIDPVALADRLVDRERAKAETSVSEAAGHVVDIVFVERWEICHRKEGACHDHTKAQRCTPFAYANNSPNWGRHTR